MIVTRSHEQKQSERMTKEPYSQEYELKSISVALSQIEDLRQQLRNSEGKCTALLIENGEMFDELQQKDADLAARDKQIATLNDQARKRLGEKSDLLTEITSLKNAMHDASVQSNKEYCEACQRHDQRAVRQQEIDSLIRRIKRLPNYRMGSSDKLLAIDFVEMAAARYYDLKDFSLPFHPVMEQVAERLGLSPSQLTRINKTQKTAGSWKYQVDRTFKERIGKKEIYECTVTVELDKLLSDPESIQKPEGPKGAHQGGTRVRLCQDCGSDDMDRYALEYCRSCGKAHPQLLPGLRGDANIDDAITAIKEDRYTVQDHLHDYAAQGDEQKHDAFNITQVIHELEEELTEDQTSNIVVQLPGQAEENAEQPLTPQQMTQTINAIIAEQQPAQSMMQSRGTIEESLQDAKKAGLVPDALVSTPQGTAHVLSVAYCPILHRLRCPVRTNTMQKDGSYLAVFDLTQVQPIVQGTLIEGEC